MLRHPMSTDGTGKRCPHRQSMRHRLPAPINPFGQCNPQFGQTTQRPAFNALGISTADSRPQAENDHVQSARSPIPAQPGTESLWSRRGVGVVAASSSSPSLLVRAVALSAEGVGVLDGDPAEAPSLRRFVALVVFTQTALRSPEQSTAERTPLGGAAVVDRHPAVSPNPHLVPTPPTLGVDLSGEREKRLSPKSLGEPSTPYKLLQVLLRFLAQFRQRSFLLRKLRLQGLDLCP